VAERSEAGWGRRKMFSSGDQGIDWAIICAATLMTSAPLLISFVLLQR
jgi:sn-glycerol 3-phosphate transport system permease protein